MNWYEGLWWFARRHGWHLGPKIIGVVLFPFLVVWLLSSLPSFAMSAIEKSNQAKQVEVIEDESSKESSEQSVKPVGLPPTSADARAVPPTRARASSAGGEGSARTAGPIEEVRAEVVRRESNKEVRIVMLHQKGVVLNDSRKIAIGEALEYEGTQETLAIACAVCGVIVFESGKGTLYFAMSLFILRFFHLVPVPGQRYYRLPLRRFARTM